MALHKVTASETERQRDFCRKVRELDTSYGLNSPRGSSYFIMTFGCQQNENDSERMSGLLQEMGYFEASGYEDADLIFLNTCSVRENADDRLFGHLGMMKNLKRDKPQLLVGICGCMMTQDVHVDKIKKSYPFVDMLFGPQDIYRLPEILWHRLTDSRRVYEIGSDDTLAEDIPIQRARKHRALVSIMFGCNNFCTYCIVPYTRGRERSREFDQVIRELKQLAIEGYKEVMLLGQNVNSYGQDLRKTRPDHPDFADLMEAAAQIPELRRIRFMTSHPKDISDKLIDVIGRYTNIEPHLHLPIQSGSNSILQKMNRHYTREQYLEIIRKAREARPGITFSTDLIVGFPGETEQDFEDTLDLMRQVRFSSAFTFIYSKRTGTPAAELDDQIDAAVIKERFKRLLDLQNEHSLASNLEIEGQLVEVLLEGRSDGDPEILSGRTADSRLVNLRVHDLSMIPERLLGDDGLLDGSRLEGSMAQVRITKAKTFSLEGELEQLET
ncbi:MAG: tRNA (N6-isopentenyl adenosine(37)-C2)-methylthiotransferase MiaB [Clostridiaceae bacterium]|nr:tRNA (N6-isopentenyl adenosine(37)-C2)-methylthiotransferase MiaB [Clostridiaceae bacterium]